MGAVSISNLKLSLSGKQILHDINLNIPQGSLYALLGSNGAGKTTTMRAMLGFLPFQEGKISFFGTDVSRLHRLSSAIGIALDPPGLDDTLTVAQNLEVSKIRGAINSGRTVDEVLELVDLSSRKDNFGSNLSHGQGRRAAVARALLGDPDLLVLDEPLSGLDPKGVERMLSLFNKLVSVDGKTIILSSHHLREVEHVCTHVALIEEGRTRLEGKVSDLVESRSSTLVVKGSDIAAVKSKLKAYSGAQEISFENENELNLKISSDFDLSGCLARLNGLSVAEFFVRRPSLLDIVQEVADE